MHNLTYLDMNGRPRVRRFVLAAMTILALLSLLALWERRPLVQGVSPLQVAVQRSSKTAAASQLLVPGPEAQPNETEVQDCPLDPNAWELVEIFPGDNYRRIEPACVYEGLGRTSAWILLERMGYSKPEAAELLGFEELPWSPLESVEGFTNLQGPKPLSMSMEWPAHPDFNFWQVNVEGQPAAALGLRGCYRHEAEVYCVLALDRTSGSAVSVLGEDQFASHAANLPGLRVFLLLEYKGQGNWNLIGQLADLTLPIDEIGLMAEDRLRLAGRLGTVSWDSAWLWLVYGLSPKPLPEGWRLFSMDEEAMVAIAAELNRFVPDLEEGGDD